MYASLRPFSPFSCSSSWNNISADTFTPAFLASCVFVTSTSSGRVKHVDAIPPSYDKALFSATDNGYPSFFRAAKSTSNMLAKNIDYSPVKNLLGGKNIRSFHEHQETF
jgi:hypothetical protein